MTVPPRKGRRVFLRAAGSIALGAAGCGPGAPAASGGALDAGEPDAAPAGSGAAPAGPAQDAGRAEVPEYRDAGAGLEADLPPWDRRTSSESTSTVLMFRGNRMRNFHGTGPLSSSPVLKWRHRMGALSVAKGSGPKVHWTGTGWTGQAVKWGRRLFAGGLDGRFYCWDAATGAVVWTLKTDRMFKSSPCFYKGMLYVGNVDNHFRCIDAESGSVMWKHDMKHDCDSSPLVIDNVVYTGSEAGVLYALDADTGHVHLSLDLGGGRGPGGSQGIESSPAVVGDDLYVATYDGVLYRIDLREGAVASRIPTGDDTDASPVIHGDRVYVAVEAKNPTVQCFDRRTEKRLWQFQNQGGFWSTPAVVGDRLYVGGDDAKLYCLDARTGERLWSFSAGRAVWASPCVVDDKVVFGSYDGFLYMLDAASGKELWRYDLAGPVLSTACIVDGWIYVGSGDGHFYCFGA